MQLRTEALSQHSEEIASRSLETYNTRDWNENVLHVYPRTFNEVRPEGEAHRGVGSILGIIDKLDWMKDLGVTAIWLGPIYESPGLDGNYDISNYYEVNADLGTLEDAKLLIDEAHTRDIRVIFDLVPNHTSDQSEWFKASSDPTHPEFETYKDYYVWRDPVVGELPKNVVGDNRLNGLSEGLTVPNNWTSIFSKPQIDRVCEAYGGEFPEGASIPAVTAWVWNEARGQFYLAEFMKEQPTLDWRNPRVREEIKQVARFWFDLGVDSFRIDVLNHIGKDASFENEETAPIGTKFGEYMPGVTNPHDQWKQEKLVSHWPELGEYVTDLFSVADEPAYSGRNIRFVPEDWMSVLGHDTRLDELRPDRATVFNFEMLLNTDRAHWTARNIGKVAWDYYTRIGALPGAVPNQVTGNHDVDTLRTRLGSAATARTAHLMLAALPGALYTWQGDVLGRPNAIIPSHLQRDGAIGQRDGERIPMQWDPTKNGGFSQANSEMLWLPAVDEQVYLNDNIELQSRDPNSPYRFVRDALRRKRDDPALHEGKLRMLHVDHAGVVAFARADPHDSRRQIISITNFLQDTVSVSILDAAQSRGRISLSSIGRDRNNEEIVFNRPIILPPDSSYLIDTMA